MLSEKRIGCCTASRLSDALNTLKGGSSSAAREKYKYEIVAERLTGKASSKGFESMEMRYGAEMESTAIAAYMAQSQDLGGSGVVVQEPEYVPHPSIPYFGATPDGLVNDDGLLEVKCPKASTHVRYLLNPQALVAEYGCQAHGQLECTGRKWCDLVSYCIDMPRGLRLLTERVLPDPTIVQKVELFLGEVEGLINLLLRFEDNESSNGSLPGALGNGIRRGASHGHD